MVLRNNYRSTEIFEKNPNIRNDSSREVSKQSDPTLLEKTLSLNVPFRNNDKYSRRQSAMKKLIENIPEHSKVLIHSSGVIQCLDQGSFPHPVSCKKFISCAKMETGSVLGWEYTCPKDLSFDPIGGMCNWSADLGCEEQWLENVKIS